MPTEGQSIFEKLARCDVKLQSNMLKDCIIDFTIMSI